MLVSQILKDKGDLVFTISPGDTVEAVAALLFSRRVGAMIVVDDSGAVAGIVSERDIVRAVASEGAAALVRPISAYMTSQVHFAETGETVDSLLERMTDRRVRHLPVLVTGRLVGIVSIGDLVKHKISEVTAEAEGLRAYIVSG